MRPVLLATLLAAGLTANATAQASATLPTSDPAHEDVSVLVHHGLVRDALMGQRPFSWREVALFVERGREGLDALKAAEGEASRIIYLGGILERLSGRVAARAEGRPLALDDAHGEAAWLDSPPHGFPDNGLGLLDASVNPLVQSRDGRPLLDGTTAAAEVGISGRPAPWLAVAARPRAWVGRRVHLPAGADATPSDAAFQSLYGRAVFGNVALLVGRDHLVWGPSPEAGTLVSRNSRAFDMAQVSSDLPFRMPWIFRHLGPTHLSFFASDMGAERNFPHTLLFGAKASFLPHPNLEIGASFLNEQGGEGAPEATFADRVIDILFFPDIVLSDTELVFSEKLAGMDVRLRLPELDGLELYLEAAITDIDIDRAHEMFNEEAAYTAGALLPRLGGRGAGRLRLEGYHVGVRPYRHYQFVSGMALDGDIIGNPLGPDARGAMAALTWETERGSVGRGGILELRGAVENRSVDLHDVIDEPFFHNIVFVEDRPDETRWRLLAGWRTPAATASLAVDAQVGVERVDGFAYTAGRSRTNVLARLQVGWRWR